eukprot:179584-Alexandrium_andersonii.AAC.1
MGLVRALYLPYLKAEKCVWPLCRGSILQELWGRSGSVLGALLGALRVCWRCALVWVCSGCDLGVLWVCSGCAL